MNRKKKVEKENNKLKELKKMYILFYLFIEK